MKKRLLFLFAIIAAMATAMAKPVDQATAKKVATTYLQSVTGKTFSDLTDITAQSPFHEYYVFTLGNGGFILVSGDDCVMPVLAYSENTPFVLENMPDHIMEWMQMYDNQIAFYRSRVGRLDYGGSQVVENQWRCLSEGTILRSQYPSAVSPLLSTTWNQSPYYNQLCPQTVDGTKCVTGCAATACAQIMKYWNHPSTGYGSHTYYHTTFDSLSANFGTTTYNWSNMPNALNASSTNAQVQAVATLMYHVGVSIDMNYGTSAQGGSAGATSSWGSAMNASVENSLVQYFKYKQSCHTIYHDEFSDDEWGSMLRAELDASRPILYTGFDVDAGHAFVFDGYNNQGQFHVNWGWGSYCDGYYTVGQLNPSTGGTGGNTSGTYNLDSYALIGIEPNTNWSSSASTTVSLSVSNSSAGSVYGSGTYPFGSTIYMSATANDVNRFYKWSDGSTLVSREAIAAGGNLNLTAYVGPLSGDTLSYCFNTYYTNYGWGDQSTDVYWGFKLPASTLAGHDPLSVVKIFVDDTGTFDLIIYTGANDPETTIYTGTYHLHNSEQWNDMILSTPLAVTGNDNLWIFVHNYGLEYPMTLSSGSGNNYGSLYSAGMAPTQNYYTFGGDYAWMMKAIFGEYTGDSGEQTSGCTRYVTIGSEESNANSYYTPVNNYYNYSLSETIIDAEEIGGPLNISSLSYYYSYDSPSTSKTNCTIYLQPTTKTVFADASDIVPLNLNTAVMVYSGSLNCSMGWNEFVFNTPFEYDGTSNLLVIVDDNSGQYNSSSYTFRVSPSNGVKTITWYSDNSNPDVTNLTTFSGNTNYIYNRALMKLAGCPPCTEAVVEIGNVESSTSENQIPFNCYYNYSLSETIIQADEIDGPMEISGISYKYASTDTPTTSKYGIKIWIKPTNKNAFASNSDVEILDASAVLVYDGTPAIAQGWNDIVFDTPFSYNGDGNIMVIVNDTVYGYDGLNYKFNTAPCSGNLTLAWFSDSYVPSPYSSTFSGNKYTYAFRPVMMLKGCNYSGEGSYCAPVTGVAVTSVGTTSVSVSFDTNSAASYDVYVYTATGSVACSTSTSTGTATLSNLNPATTYFLRVQADCGDGVYSILSNPVSFTTAQQLSDAAPLPFFCNFEGWGDNGWQFVNGTQSNYWIIDSATNYSGEKALYITNDGFANAYTTASATSTVFVTRLVNVTESGSYTYRYNWKAYGESSYDFMRAALVPANVVFSAGAYNGFNNTTDVPTGAIPLDNGRLNLSSDWQTASGEITITDTGLYNIVFMWRNDNSSGSQPPAAVDNVFLSQNTCPMPQNIVSTATSTSITLTWNAGGSETSWMVTCDATTNTVNTNSYTFTGLAPNQDYFVTLKSLCGADETSLIYETTIHTNCASETLPFYEDFSSNLFNNTCWRGASNATAEQVFAGTALNLTTPTWSYASNVKDGLEVGHYFKNVYGSNLKAWLITPAIDLTSASSPQLSFDVALTDYNNAALPDVNGDTNNSQAFMVIVSTDGGNTWSADNATVWQNEDGDFTYASLGDTAYQSKVIDLTQYVGNTIKIAFYCQSLWSGGDNDLHIDNIAVTDTSDSSCPAPTITVTAFSNRNVSFSWTSTADSVLVGLFNHDGQQIIGQFMPATDSVSDFYLPEAYFPFGYGYVAALSVCGAYADHNLSGTVFESFAITCDEEEQCTVTFLLTDSYGDGWNGGALDIYDTVSGLVVCSMTAPDLGGQDTPLTHITTYDLCPNRVYSIVYRSGQFDNEVSFTILGPDSTVYGSFSNPNAGVLGYFTHICPSAGDDCVTVFPFSENFEDGVMPECWTTDGPGSWSVGTGDYSSSTGAHTGSYNARITHSSSGNVTKLITPVIDMTGVTNAELRFWHVQRNWSGDQDILTVYYRTSATSDWQTLDTYTSNITTWTEEVIALPNLSSNYQIAFEMTDSWGYGVAIDDITIDLPPACAAVTGLTASTVTNNSVTLEWSDINNTGATYSVYAVTPTGAALVSGNISGTSYTITNLTAQTNYTFGVTADCSADLSSTMTTLAVTTMPDPIMCGADEALAFANADSITNTTQYFPGYSYYNYSYSEVIIPVTRLLGLGEIKGMEYYVNSIAAGSSYFNNCEIYLMNTTATSLAEGFIQDTVNLQLVYSGDLNQTETGWKLVTFNTSFMYDGASNLLVAVRRNHGSWASSGTFGSYTADAQLARYVYNDNNAYTIGEITGGTATANVPVYHMIGCTGNIPDCMPITNLTVSNVNAHDVTLSWTDNSNTGATYTVYNMADNSIVASGITGTNYVVTGLTPETAYSFGVEANCSATAGSFVITVSTTTPPSCFPVTDIAISDLTSTSATISWNGAANSYLVVVTDGTNSVYNNVVNDSTVALTGLTFETNYSVSIYAICGVDDTSAVSTASLYTGYCLPSPSSVDGNGITSVSFGGMTNTTSHAGTTAAYVNNSSMSGSVSAGTTATVDITYETGYTYGTIIWVDWNNSMTFEGNEVVYVGASDNTNPTTLSASFYIPAEYAQGNYRMRILAADMAFDSYIGSISAAAAANPCASFSWGVAEDYTLAVTDAVDPDTVTITIAVNDATMGTTNPAPGTYQYTVGTTVNITAIPNSGYMVAGWVASYSIQQGVVSSDTLLSTSELFANPMEIVISQDLVQLDNLTLTALFDVDTIVPTNDSITIIYAVNDATMGTTNPAPGAYRYAVGQYFSVTAVPNTGYRLIDMQALFMGQVYSLGNTSLTFADSAYLDYDSLVITAFFAEECQDSVALPFNDGFEYGVDCWTLVNTDQNTGVLANANYSYQGNNSFVFKYNTNPPQYLITPRLAGTGNGVLVEFYYRVGHNSYPESFQIGYSTTTNDTSAFVWGAEQTNLTNTTYLHYQEVLNATGIKYVAVKYTANDMYYLFIDDFVVREVPSCASVTDLTVTAATTNSITLSWTDANNSGATYSVYDMTDTTVIATGINTTTYTVTGLTAATTYSFGVVANCSATELSGMVSIMVGTECDIISTYPYIQDFNNGAPCWSAFDADGDGNNWELIQGALHSASFDNNSGVLYPDNWLITPHFLLAQGTNYEVTWNANPQDPSWPAEHYGLYVSTTDTDTDSFTLIQDWTLTSAGHVPVIDLSSYAGQSVYLAFRHWNCSDMFQIAIDNFQLREAAGSNQITVTLTQNNPMYGSVDGGGVYNIGDNVTVTATPSNGYQFSRWTDVTGSTVSTSNPYSFVAATDITLQAVFINGSADTYTITVDVNDSTMGTAMGSGSYAAGDVAVLTAYAFPGYRFVNWTQNGINLGSDNPFTMTVTNNSAAYPIIANFEVDSMPPLEEYLTLITAVNNPAWGTMTPAPGTYNLAAGETVHFSATPYEGYHFLSADISVFFMGIHMADTTVYTNLSEIDLTVAEEMLGATINVTVNFVPDSHEPAVLHVSYDPAMGHVLINGLQDSVYSGVIGETVTLEAVANDGYVFDTWSDGVTNATRTLLLVDEDYTISASFMESEGIDIAGILAGLKVYPNPTYGKVTIDADNVHRVQVMDLNGRVVTTFENTNIFDLSNLTSGVYMLRIETANGTTVRRIVKK